MHEDEDDDGERTVSETEDYYDKEIAPVLLELANKCAERGMHFLAQVEYEPECFSLTRKFSDKPHLAMVMLYICAMSKHNVDSYIINLLRYLHQEGIDASASMILQPYLREHDPRPMPSGNTIQIMIAD